MRRGVFITIAIALLAASTGACSLVSLDGLSGGASDASTDRPSSDAEGAVRNDADADDSGSASAEDSGPIDSGSCTGAAGEVVFDTLGSTQVVGTDWSNAPQLASLDRGECPVVTDSKNLLPSRAVVVLNATGAPAKLSAWGSCSSGDDEIHVAVYARSTLPTTASELGMCTGYSAAWYTGDDKKNTRSSENGGSAYCNGLTAKNANLTLAPCERAAVVFQHDESIFKGVGPARGKIRLE